MAKFWMDQSQWEQKINIPFAERDFFFKFQKRIPEIVI